jgi:hypothetical protein
VQSAFLDAWHSGRPQLPKVEYEKNDYSRTREELEEVFLGADPGHPVGDYLRRTAQSWRTATELLDAVGTPAISEYSIRLFGRPGDLLPGGTVIIWMRGIFIELADELAREIVTQTADFCLAEVLRKSCARHRALAH